ncbi:hydrolase [Halorhodospira halochloris]|uniref:Hydrolase n=1 Tax=Halorhodospira halochloris TaxID=1052 RepID=A0A0X8X9P3_HALHR|nr:hydrolase [Halorhodospira halochloris]BAU58071.2 hydrolase [Halorhodospira halochloris]
MTHKVYNNMTRGSFSPAWWLPGCHSQTMFPAVFRRAPQVKLIPEKLELPDGDFLDLMWGPPGKGLALIGHGLGGNERSGYVRGLIAALAERGIGSVVMIARGAGDTPNRSQRSYHAAAWDDLDAVIDTLHRRYPQQPLAACGFSLSGSILLNWLGQRPDKKLSQAVAVSVPFDLQMCAYALEQGIGVIYQQYLLRRLKPLAERKFKHSPQAPVTTQQIRNIRRLREFDDLITAPINGFADSTDYYRRASCRQRLKRIEQPTAIIHALDDPFVPEKAVPTEDELGPGISLELTQKGGHVGFVKGAMPGYHSYWLDQRIADWIEYRVLQCVSSKTSP